MLKRRNFLQQSLRAGAGAFLIPAIPLELLALQRKHLSPSDRIGVALIGCKGMGWANLTTMLKMPEVHCVAICDIDDTVLQQRVNELDKINIKPDTYKDHRKMLERKDVDVVIIATPDHWHCLQMTDACAAGKHVYVEKPLSNTVAEAAVMVAAARRFKSVVQVNQWQRSQQHFKDAISFVKSGKLGTIAQTKAWMYNGHALLPSAPDGLAPAGVDYNRWLGPAPARTFNPNRFHYNFRWYWDYAGGLMTDWGVHLVDMVLHGMDAALPTSVVSMGGHLAFPQDARETPDTQTAVYDYGTFQMIWEHTMGRQYGAYGMGHGIAFIGSNGTLLLNRSGWEVRPERDGKNVRMEAIAWQPSSDNGLNLHTQNFIAAVKSNDSSLLHCPVEAGANVAVHCHLGNVAFRTGEKLEVSGSPEALLAGSSEANTLLIPEYHNGWELPKY